MGLELTLIFSFSKYLLKTHEVLDILLNTGNSEENKTYIFSAIMELTVQHTRFKCC